MLNWKNILYVLCISIFIVGFRNLIFVTETPISLSLVLFCLPLLVMYLIHITALKNPNKIFYYKIDLRNVSLGLLLVLLVMTYNLITHGVIGPLDFGLLIAGLSIIILNIIPPSLHKLDKELVSFCTYFVFSYALIYLAIFELPLRIAKSKVNPLFVPLTHIITDISLILLNFIKPTTVAKVTRGPDGFIHSMTINFDGLNIGIGDPCSGIVSITVFLTVIIAYYIATGRKDSKKTFFFAFLGVCALFIVNLLRIIIISVTGYYFGPEAMLFVHENLGWIFFVAIMAIFWYYTLEKRESVCK